MITGMVGAGVGGIGEQAASRIAAKKKILRERNRRLF
jgi:hypothetical protein